MLTKLFNDLISYGRFVRSKKLNGLDYWNKIKDIIKKYNPVSINTTLGEEWTISRIFNGEQIYRQTDNLSEIYTFVHDILRMYGEESDDVKYHLDHDLWSKYHFYLQLARIPANNKLDLGRLLQIAYNLGQLSVHLHLDPVFTSDTITYFQINKLNDINSYINLDEKEFDDEQNDILNNIDLDVKRIIESDVKKINDESLLGGFEKKLFYGNLEELTLQNNNYRKVLYTGLQQMVLMNLKPKDFIKQEVHDNTDQFIRIEKGNGIATINDVKYELKDGIGLIIPAGSQHKIENTSSTNNLSLYSIYSPPEHAENLVQESNPESKTNYLNKYLKYKKKYISLKK